MFSQFCHKLIVVSKSPLRVYLLPQQNGLFICSNFAHKKIDNFFINAVSENINTTRDVILFCCLECLDATESYPKMW